MSEQLKDFFVSIGFAVDESQRKEAIGKARDTQREITANADAEGAQRMSREQFRQKLAAAGNNDLSKIRVETEKRTGAAVEKVRADVAKKDGDRETETAKKARERRETAFKQATQYALAFSGIATGIMTAVEGVATGIALAVGEAAKSFDRLHFASQWTGASPQKIGAFTYAISQLGGTVEDAGASLDTFGKKLRGPGGAGFEQMLQSFGVKTRDAAGQLRDSAAIATDALQALGKRPQAESIAFANAFGFDDATRRAGADPRLREFEAQREKDQADVGFNPNDAAADATPVAQSMRRLSAIAKDVGEKIESDLFKKVKPLLDQLADWIAAHGKEIAEVVGTIADKFIAFTTTLTEKLKDVDYEAIFGKKGGKDGLIPALEAVAAVTLTANSSLGGMLGLLGKLARLTLPPWLTAMLVAGGGGIASILKMSSDAEKQSAGPEANDLYVNDEGLLVKVPAGGGNMPDRPQLSGNLWERTKQFFGFGGGKGGGPGILKAQQATNAAIIADELRKGGMPEEGVAAALGSMQSESGFNPRAHNDVNGGHDGLWQWDAARWAKVRAWILSQNGDPSDVHWQARAFMAEGNARPGERIYDGPRTSAGYRKMMQSRGNVDLAVEGVYDSERFGIGEEAGRANNARAWLKNMPKAPDQAAPQSPEQAKPPETVAQKYAKEPRLPPNAMYWARDANGNRVAVDAQGRAVKADGTPTTVGPASKPMSAPPTAPDIPSMIQTPPLGPTPSILYQYDQSRKRGDQTINANQTFNISGGDVKQNVEAARLAAGRGTPDWIANLQGAEQ